MFWKGKILYYYEFILCRKNKKIRLSENSTLISGEVFLSFSCVRDKLTNCSGPYSWNSTERLVIIYSITIIITRRQEEQDAALYLERGEHEFPWKYKRKRTLIHTWHPLWFLPVIKESTGEKRRRRRGLYRDMSRAQPAALYYILSCF